LKAALRNIAATAIFCFGEPFPHQLPVFLLLLFQVQQYGCADIPEQAWMWVPDREYKAKKPHLAHTAFD
jgi:hypothetical protein